MRGWWRFWGNWSREKAVQRSRAWVHRVHTCKICRFCFKKNCTRSIWCIFFFFFLISICVWRSRAFLILLKFFRRIKQFWFVFFKQSAHITPLQAFQSCFCLVLKLNFELQLKISNRIAAFINKFPIAVPNCKLWPFIATQNCKFHASFHGTFLLTLWELLWSVTPKDWWTKFDDVWISSTTKCSQNAYTTRIKHNVCIVDTVQTSSNLAGSPILALELQKRSHIKFYNRYAVEQIIFRQLIFAAFYMTSNKDHHSSQSVKRNVPCNDAWNLQFWVAMRGQNLQFVSAIGNLLMKAAILFEILSWSSN